MSLLTSGIYCSIIDNHRRGIKHCYCYPWQFIFSQGDVINYRDSDRQRDAAARMCTRARACKYGFSLVRTIHRSADRSIKRNARAHEAVYVCVPAVHATGSLLSPVADGSCLVIRPATPRRKRERREQRRGKKPFVLSALRNYPVRVRKLRLSIISIFLFRRFISRARGLPGARTRKEIVGAVNESRCVSPVRELSRV